ncbi:MAG: hypothetical protein K0R65_1507 [Crocinitomicaceae bacterium]|jgi:hypothetical protein|nr:hypothetical protein [Crocinitomicaceae bacterium]
MKQTFTFFALLLSSLSFAQNYQPFTAGREYHYSRTIGDRDYIFSMKLNFDYEEFGDSVFANYLQVNVLPSQLPNFSLDGQCIGNDSWIGKRGIKTAGGDIDFMTEYDLPVHIRSNAVLNESWNFHQLSSNTHFIATVTDIYEDNVLGTLDSIKEITLELFNEDNNNIMPHAFNGKKILLSKNKGFVQVYNFFRFPQETQTFTLIGNGTEGEHPLAEEDLYRFEIGDYLVYSADTYKDFLIVTHKTQAPDNYVYHFKRVIRNSNNVYNYVDDEILQLEFVPGAYRLMGQYDSPSADYYEPYSGVTVNYKENNLAYIAGYSFLDFLDPCWYYNSTYGSQRSNTYMEGLGFIHQDYSEWYEDYDEWGNPVNVSFSSSRNLNYYNGSFEYGAYEHPYLQAMLNSNKTESCDGVIAFNTPVAGINSLLWHFGDGQQSSLPDPGHNYTAAGSYTVSVDLFSDFGDTTLTMANQIIVGNNNSDHVANPVKMLGGNCNSFIFTDQTDVVTSRTWTFPGGETFTDSLVNYTFSDTGTYVIYLENAHGYCADDDSLELTIRTIQNPVAAICPVQSPGYSLFGFELDDVAIEGSYYYQPIESPAYDGFMNGCNVFELEAGDEVNLRLYVGYYELIDVGMGNYDPWYNGFQFDVWIDYNNDGGFDVSEQVASSYCGSNLDIGAYNIYGYGLFTVPLEAVRGVPLRMRLGANSENNPCQGDMYDFSVLIPYTLGQDEKTLSATAGMFPNPGKGDFQLKLNNETAISKLDVKVLDISGQEVLSFNHKNLAPQATSEINLEKFTSGVYFVEIRIDGQAAQTIKVVKE